MCPACSQLAEAKDRKARKAAQQTLSQAKGRVSKYQERLQELAATPGAPKVEVGSLEEVRFCRDRWSGHSYTTLLISHLSAVSPSGVEVARIVSLHWRLLLINSI